MTIRTNFQILIVDSSSHGDNTDAQINPRQQGPVILDDLLDDESSFYSDDADSISFFGLDGEGDDQSITHELQDLTSDGSTPRCLEEWIESLDLGLSQHSACSSTIENDDDINNKRDDGETSAAAQQMRRRRRFQQALRDMANEDPFELQDSLHIARNRGVPVSRLRSGNAAIQQDSQETTKPALVNVD